MTTTMSYADFLARYGLTRDDRPDCSDEDFGATEVTLYDDGTAAYTDGGERVPLREEDADLLRAAAEEALKFTSDSALRSGPWAHRSRD